MDFRETNRRYSQDGRFSVATTDECGNETTMVVDAVSGRTLSRTDSLQNTIDFSYNEYGQTLQMDNDVTEVFFAYNGSHELSQITVSANASSSDLSSESVTEEMTYHLTYDAFGNLTCVSDDSKTYVTDTYQAGNGPLLNTTYGNGDSVSYTYDEYERVSAEIWGTEDSTPAVEYKYDNRGYVTKTVDYESGVIYTSDYDHAGRPTASHTDYEGETVRDVWLQKTYDSAGRDKRFSARYGGRTYTTNYSYLNNDLPTVTNLPSGSKLSNDYDILGRVQSRTFDPVHATREGMNVASYSGKKQFRTEILYQTPRTPLPASDGSTYQVGNTTNLPSEYILSVGGYEKVRERVSYDARSRVSDLSRSLNGGSDETSSLSYTYDKTGRVICVCDAVTQEQWDYSYDALGNLNSSVYTDSPAGTTVRETYRYSADNAQLLEGFATTDVNAADGTISYDGGGNPVTYLGKDLAWSHGRNLTEIRDPSGASVAAYSYDHTGIRTKKQVGRGPAAVITTYVLAGDKILSQTSGSETLNFYYDSEGTLREIGYRNGSSAEKEYYVGRNALGDVDSLYTPTGVLVGNYRYDPYGKLLGIIPASGYTDSEGILQKNPFRYRGYYYDTETGWYYLKSRYYDPTTKRFINADDVSYLGAGDEGNSYNLYAYCGGDPVNNVDENGYLPSSDELFMSFEIFTQTEILLTTIGVSLIEGLIIGGLIAGGLYIGFSTYHHITEKKQTPIENKLIVNIEKSNETANEILKRKKGNVNREFPSQWRDATMDEIDRAAKKGDPSAKKAKKLLNDHRFDKGDNRK